MAHDVQRPHDKLFRTVFADHGEAAALLRAHLPESLARDLRWSTLTLQDRSFVDPDLRDTESDLLFSIRRKAGAPPAWLYVLLEHQSRPDRWIRFRLLKYCCRIWDRSRRQFPRERRLRPIVPLVFYQGPAAGATPPSSPSCSPTRCATGPGCRASLTCSSTSRGRTRRRSAAGCTAVSRSS